MGTHAIRFAVGLAVLLCAGAAGAGPARAQTRDADDCVVPRESSGLIRGDRVPTGCVMTERPAPTPEPLPTVVFGSTVVLVPVLIGSRIFLPDPPFIGVPPGRGAVTGADSLPRVRSGSFGPIERPFGPVTQPFRPTNRDFAILAAPARDPAPSAP